MDKFPCATCEDLPTCKDALEWGGLGMELEGKGLKAWTRANTLSYLNTLTGQKNARISDAAKALDKEDAEAFILKVKEAVEMA